MASSVFLYLINNVLVFWLGLPGPYALLFSDQSLSATEHAFAWLQISAYLLLLALTAFAALRSVAVRSLVEEADRLSHLVAYIVRFAFWAVLLIGVVDATISFLRVENFLPLVAGSDLASNLGHPSFRGLYVHYSLMLLALVVAWRCKKISFSWLALLVVVSEFLIVISRFIFSYEQAFMGDLVRFWYAGLFLFGSAYTLVHEGHVRVDVLYAGMSEKGKAKVNIAGCLLLGIPLCWVILMQGMGGRGHSINAPLLGFEVSQSSYGMYVKYLMAGFLVVFSLTMLLQFLAVILRSIATLTLPEQAGEVAQDNDAGQS